MEYNIQYNIGKAKYLVSYHKGEKYKDGSKFFDIAIFKNKNKMKEFIKTLNKKEEKVKTRLIIVIDSPTLKEAKNLRLCFTKDFALWYGLKKTDYKILIEEEKWLIMY